MDINSINFVIAWLESYRIELYNSINEHRNNISKITHIIKYLRKEVNTIDLSNRQSGDKETF